VKKALRFTAVAVVSLVVAMMTASAWALAPPPPSASAPRPPFGGVLQLGPDGKPIPRRAPGDHSPPIRVVPPDHNAEHGAAHEEEHEGPPGDVNWTDFSNKEQPPYLAAVLNFGILAFIYVYFGRKPLANALVTRREGVSKQIEEAQKIKHEAEARQKQYTAKLEDLGTELATTKASLAAAGAGEKARIVREAEEKAARMEKDAAFLLEQERKQVQLDLQREAVNAALAEAEALLRSKLTPADQERLAEEFLSTLVPAKAGSRAGAAS
jgi:F-type H+-transporting ATPase subunit b